MWSIVTAPLKLTAVSNNSKSNECAYRLFIESFNCSLGPCLSEETIELSDQTNWFANAGDATEQRGVPSACPTWEFATTCPCPHWGCPNAATAPAAWSRGKLANRSFSKSVSWLHSLLFVVVVVVSSLDNISGRLMCGKSTSNFPEFPGEMCVARSGRRKGSEEKAHETYTVNDF